MNRSWVIITKVENLTEVAPLNRLWYAESNSPDKRIRLSGRPEIKEAIKVFLEALPPTYDKAHAKELVIEAVDEVFVPDI